jgi:signal transduction histidine kinase
VDAIHQVTSAFAAETGIAATVAVAGDPRPLSADREVVVLRATQEALTNIRKYADAQHVDVAVTYADEVTLSVTDDGRGFELDHPHEGFGLAGFRRRVAQVGGTVEVTSSLGFGSTIRVELP